MSLYPFGMSESEWNHTADRIAIQEAQMKEYLRNKEAYDFIHAIGEFAAKLKQNQPAISHDDLMAAIAKFKAAQLQQGCKP